MMPNDPNFAPPSPVTIRPLSSNGLFNVSSGPIHVSYDKVSFTWSDRFLIWKQLKLPTLPFELMVMPFGSWWEEIFYQTYRVTLFHYTIRKLYSCRQLIIHTLGLTEKLTVSHFVTTMVKQYSYESPDKWIWGMCSGSPCSRPVRDFPTLTYTSRMIIWDFLRI